MGEGEKENGEKGKGETEKREKEKKRKRGKLFFLDISEFRSTNQTCWK